MGVTQTQAEVVRDQIRAMFRPYLDEHGVGPVIYDGPHEGMSSDVKVIWWEEGPYEWAIVASSGGQLDEEVEMAHAVNDKDSAHSYDPIKVAGLFLEPVNGSCLGVYEA